LAQRKAQIAVGNGIVARRELLGAEETHYSDDQVLLDPVHKLLYCCHHRGHNYWIIQKELIGHQDVLMKVIGLHEKQVKI